MHIFRIDKPKEKADNISYHYIIESEHIYVYTKERAFQNLF